MTSKASANQAQAAPKHLSTSAAAWFNVVVNSFELEAHHTLLLTAACEAWDRGQQAREVIAIEGAYFTDRQGNRKAHGAIQVEKDCRISFARIVRELDLNTEPPKDSSRPPQLSRYGRR
jgi:phage terminase small subunit